ncbi:MAG: glycosyltransferase family 4 protein [Acidobacteria bacterium]|nr:glycosyltransferase family 4 protein [Acidobacteriota bacterium]
MSTDLLRVGLDLDGSLESLSNSMVDLATALSERGDLELRRFRTMSPPRSPEEQRLSLRALWAPWWRRSRGRAIDAMLGSVDVVHLAGRATPPTRSAPLLISVDDLRPLRAEREHQRVIQLQRAVRHGAVLVASSRAARGEVMAAMRLARPEIVVVRPPVSQVSTTRDGTDLVVSVNGNTERFEALAEDLQAFADRRRTAWRVIASDAVLARLRARGVRANLVARRDAAQTLSHARVVVCISDGARFPAFAIAALSAGVPTLARAIEINRELLGGAAALIHDDDEAMDALEDLWSNDAHRAILAAAGLVRAADFSPWNVASAYADLYAETALRGRP